MLQAAGDRPLFFKEEDVHPGRTREMGVEAALILARDRETSFTFKKNCQDHISVLKDNNQLGSRGLHIHKYLCFGYAM